MRCSSECPGPLCRPASLPTLSVIVAYTYVYVSHTNTKQKFKTLFLAMCMCVCEIGPALRTFRGGAVHPWGCCEDTLPGAVRGVFYGLQPAAPADPPELPVKPHERRPQYEV